MFGEADEEDQDDRRGGTSHLQTGAGHALRRSPAGPHTSADQADDTDLDADSGTEETCPVEDDGDGRRRGEAVGMKRRIMLVKASRLRKSSTPAG